MIDPTYRVDGRALNYSEPTSAVSRLVQMPAYLIDGNSLADAVMKDWRAARRAKLVPGPASWHGQGGEG